MIYGLLGNVQESFEAISSCSLVSSLEGVEAGIISARDAVEGEDLQNSVPQAPPRRAGGARASASVPVPVA